MHESARATTAQTILGFARIEAAVDALTSAIAGFALLAGARAFMFTALLGWREPVAGGAGLVLLAMVGWLRWRCGGAVAAGGRLLPASAGPDAPCYNRSSPCAAARAIAPCESKPHRP